MSKEPFLSSISRQSWSRPLAAALAGAALGALSLSASPAFAEPMQYYGGRVISNVEIIQVAWTNGGDAARLQDLATFHQTLVTTDYLDWLTEYDTFGKVGFADGQPGSSQHIGRGTWGGAFVISPSNAKTSLTDQEIGAELVARIGSGDLPAPKTDAAGNVNSLYFLEFPPQYVITLVGFQSCSQFGGYHSTVKLCDKSVPYAVIPGCGYDFPTSTFVETHELVEAITDTEAGLLPDFFQPIDRPIAWVAPADNFWNAPECADICQNLSDEIAGYTVATNWSNFANGCVVHIPICDGVSSPPACRPCNAFDDGVGCAVPTPACATTGPKTGQCVPCTAKSQGACSGATPVCDESSYTCVGCLSNADCTDPKTPVCEPATKTCRACQLDDECTDSHCDEQPDAQEGQCVECMVDTHCGPDEHCVDHVCEAPMTTTTGSGGGGAGGGGGSGGGSTSDSAGDSEGGCSCRVAEDGSSTGSWLAAALLGLLGLRRARRREEPGQS